MSFQYCHVCVGQPYRVCVCVCCYATRTIANKVSTIFPQLLLDFFLFSSLSSPRRFEEAINAWSLKIDSLSNVNDDDMARIVFASVCVCVGGVCGIFN